MYELNKKQKIIIAIILSIIIIAFLYYIYTKDENTIIAEQETIQENETKDKSEEENTQENENIIVHISGAVNKEGIVELKKNSRISNAIDKAEGLKENADIKKINLASKLEDGMKIYIPTIGEQIEGEAIYSEDSKYITSSKEEENQEIESKKSKVNINTASQTELETLPGIGPSISNKIINYRKENGKFKVIEDIKEVSGIGEAKYENIKELICVK